MALCLQANDESEIDVPIALDHIDTFSVWPAMATERNVCSLAGTLSDWLANEANEEMRVTSGV